MPWIETIFLALDIYRGMVTVMTNMARTKELCTFLLSLAMTRKPAFLYELLHYQPVYLFS